MQHATLTYNIKFLGKSTAMRCALCICGQHNSGHLMKTKGTSDSIIMERVAKSTLPFGLDDPKGTDDVGELLIQLCNGAWTLWKHESGIKETKVYTYSVLQL